MNIFTQPYGEWPPNSEQSVAFALGTEHEIFLVAFEFH